MISLPDRGCAAVPVRLRLVQLFFIGSSGAILLEIKPAQAIQPIEFQSGFMRQSPAHAGDAGAAALRALASSHDLGPGRYWVDIQINLRYFGQREMAFELSPENDRLLPCLAPELLEQLGVRLDSLADPTLLHARCVDLFTLIPGAEIDFDASKLLLAISIPQIAMRRDVSGHIDPEHWDYGINAAFINYQASAQQGSSRYGGKNNSDDLYLNTGLNLGPWRLRSNQSMRQDEDGKRVWTRAYTYAQRDLPGTHANLTLGETFTGGDVFRSIPIKGALISSDMGMLPDALQGYAPIIRGVAQTRAKLEVLQNGYPIYSTYVSPGPYEIDDLSTIGGSGELEVVLTEADGQVRRFTQPYATIGNLLREGVWRYSGALGRYNAASNLDEPLLWQGTLAMGTTWDSTLYGGLMASEFYQAGTLGIAKDLGSIGALALDVTRSSADVDRHDTQNVQGMSYAVKYGKSFATRTNLRFAGYRYSTEGYRDFDEAVRQRSHSTTFHGSRRSRLETSIYQNIGSRSAVSLTLSHQDYWHTSYEQRQFQFNFNTQHAGASYNLYASQSLSDTHGSDRQFGLSVSLPLDFGHSSTATFDVQSNRDRYSQRASLGGSLDENRLNYRVSLSNDEHQQQAAALSAGYQAPFGSLGAGLTQGGNYRSASINASGAVLMHADGIELGPYLGETTALVEVPDIAGIGVMNATGVKTNERGYALMPHLRPYRINQVVLQTDELGPEVEIDNGTTQVVPRRGAVVKATFPARSVNRLIITGRTASGLPLPFGAQLSNAQGEVMGIVGQAGQVMVSTDAEPQMFDVHWGEQNDPQCRLSVEPAAMEQAQGYRLQELTCV
ncbi:fimbria/pilus outer membrane usher protein [Pseudomonas izuensis]|uniref:Fimbrial biogenesis outer membrane usher protein n=1 Tax=Pseudomonas izuensis TaxID=2684212 RepID=A0ABM7RT41_9PSED|nr:fimbria/pilus outer membrane usher protein [Pseudomonas izuensis]BCX68051.1 fimbrial biogenesis outer membrane usher protein [Pseudomonas izuensis]